MNASIAQRIEQVCSRHLVEGSSPSRRATHSSSSLIHCNTIAATSSASAISFASRAAAHSESDLCVFAMPSLLQTPNWVFKRGPL